MYTCMCVCVCGWWWWWGGGGGHVKTETLIDIVYRRDKWGGSTACVFWHQVAYILLIYKILFWVQQRATGRATTRVSVIIIYIQI